MSLEWDVPTSEADRSALRKAHDLSERQNLDYLDFLDTFGPVSADALRARPCPIGVPRFELP